MKQDSELYELLFTVFGHGELEEPATMEGFDAPRCSATGGQWTPSDFREPRLLPLQCSFADHQDFLNCYAVDVFSSQSVQVGHFKLIEFEQPQYHKRYETQDIISFMLRDWTTHFHCTCLLWNIPRIHSDISQTTCHMVLDSCNDRLSYTGHRNIRIGRLETHKTFRGLLGYNVNLF